MAVPTICLFSSPRPENHHELEPITLNCTGTTIIPPSGLIPREAIGLKGKVVHFEIPAEDVKRAREFYKKAFDWKIDDVPEMDYAMLRTTETDEKGRPKEPGAINGGMMIRKAPIKSPVITIGVEDIAKSLEEVKGLGGKVIRDKTPVGDMGFSAYFKDTEGNIVGLFQPTRM